MPHPVGRQAGAGVQAEGAEAETTEEQGGTQGLWLEASLGLLGI